MTLAQKRRYLFSIFNRAKSICNSYRDLKMKTANLTTKNTTFINYTSIPTDIGCKLLKYQHTLQRSGRVTVTEMLNYIIAQSNIQNSFLLVANNRKYKKRSTESALESCRYLVKRPCCRMHLRHRNLIGYRFKKN